ncbi:hypothetical protein ABZ354_19905 [Streptomyces sp. NPDC005925]|uniref:hypothetical protein n=1 Tax=Streptomyces sp. NPDC005925 TaxID=3157172 RepID=UPI0033E5D426
MSSPQQPVLASESDAIHARIAEIDAAVIALVRRRAAAMAELDGLRRDGRVPRVELTRENAVFRTYEAELGRLGTGLATLLTRASAGRATADDGT